MARRTYGSGHPGADGVSPEQLRDAERLAEGLEAMGRGEIDRIGVAQSGVVVAIVRDAALIPTVRPGIPVFTLSEVTAFRTNPDSTPEAFARACALKLATARSAAVN